MKENPIAPAQAQHADWQKVAIRLKNALDLANDKHKETKRHAQRLADALTVAADWLSRSVRIDDQEQAQDAREALAEWSKQK